MADNINVEKIMQEIRENIKSSGADKITLSFADQAPQAISGATGDRLNDAVQYISYNYEVQPYQLLTGNPVKVFIKKCIRKLASFFFLPIVGQQNTLNYYYLLVAESVKDQRDEIEVMKKSIAELEAKLEQNNKERK